MAFLLISLRDTGCLSLEITCNLGKRLESCSAALLEKARFASALIRLIMVVLPYHFFIQS
ncbi:MAG TPA: hypothetical protein DCS01_05455 [Idiomarina abyssalis]|nr:hypothetical protein [Idiomarina abyssalis]